MIMIYITMIIILVIGLSVGYVVGCYANAKRVQRMADRLVDLRQ